ncbi:hypothetical protein [Flavobacterium sp. YO12]|uniref:hypothetical protein n=1 Tax=Flavobacterium sp. YO12 TaxID=1920029 RepID=UPI00100B7E62|nr:hypothetical protein [Flavobacterium sp. YO12]RXM48059.1 hypothetical protein BOW55_07705 [Flavobacterium sp. YO12]
MLTGISWGNYAAAVIVFLLIWYGILIFRYYCKNLNSFFKNGCSGKHVVKQQEKKESSFSEYNESFSTLEDAEELYNKLLSVFTESNDRSSSKTEFLHYVQFNLSEYPFVKKSALREKINSLMALESRKYPAFLITYEEMDRLWESED